MTMGTASTMTADRRGARHDAARAQRRSRAVHSAHDRDGRRDAAGGSSRWCGKTCGRRDILTPDAFDNAITVDMAIGGSTNAIIHLIAMAGRPGIKLPLERFDEI